MLYSPSRTGSKTLWVKTRRDHRRMDSAMTEEWLLPKLKILVVEDHEDTAQSMAELLNLAGCITRIARTADEALMMAGEDSPDVVLLEPLVRDGWLVSQRIRQIASPKLVIVLSSRGDEDDLSHSRLAGIDLHLIKPVAPAILFQELRRISPHS